MTENVWMITIVLGLLMVAVVPGQAAEPWVSLPWTPAKLATTMPFSFVYNGKHSAELLPSWKQTHTKQTAADGKEQQVITYTDPVTGLEVLCEATHFTDYPAVEWVLGLRLRLLRGRRGHRLSIGRRRRRLGVAVGGVAHCARTFGGAARLEGVQISACA